MSRHKVKYVQPAPVQKSCGKNRYNSEREAREVADQQELLFANKGLKLKVYHCMMCGGWHLTKHTDWL